MNSVIRRALLPLALFFGMLSARAQPGVIPTLGTEFWVGFMSNSPEGPVTMNIFISSDVNTTGTVSAPLLGINIPFTVVANVTTTVTLNSSDVMHTGSEAVDNKGVVITTQDTVAVFAINFQPYSADATVVYPRSSLGTEYQIFAYRGLITSYFENYESEFLIVSPQDGTEVEITTTAATLGGHQPGVPWTVQLDSAETYQVKAVDGVADLTGSTIVGTPASGPCRPFSVFSGALCTRVPATCTACDHIFTQNLPWNVWGQTYHSVPFATTTGYTYRLMSHLDGTVINVNGGSPVNLNAGEFVNVSNEAGAVCFSGNQPFAAAQYMQGVTCSSNGDPALLILNAEEQRINHVTFATVVSTVITDHYLNVVTNTADIGMLTLDGAPIPPASFTPFAACPAVSHASVSLSEGSHTLHSPMGFSAYAYGMGSAESYAYSVGSYSNEPQLPVDSVLCGLDSTGAITLTAPNGFYSPFWSLYSTPEDTLYEGTTYTFNPTASDVYMVTGSAYLSGCPVQYLYSIEVSDAPVLSTTVNDAITLTTCAYAPVQLEVAAAPAGTYNYSWWPSADLDEPHIANPVATPGATTWYHVSVSSLNGCAVALDSVLVTVLDGGVLTNNAYPANTMLCEGDSVQFHLDTRQIVGEDMLNGTLGALWQNVSGGTLDNICGSLDGDALYFNGPAPRTATTTGLAVPNGGSVRFALKVANGTAPCDDAEPGNDIVLQYSLTGGAPWTDMATYFEYNYPDFVMINAEIPAGAFSSNTSFRWTQVGVYGAGEDNWVLDQVVIAAIDNAGLTYSWEPTATLDDAASHSPWAYPVSTGWYTVTTTDVNTSCVYTDSVFVDVGEPFSITVTPDTALCDVAGIQLSATPSGGTGHTWAWTNGGSLNADFVQSPTATPTSTTTYGVTVTTANGCTATGDVTVNVGQLHDLTVSIDESSICFGDTVQLTAVINGSSSGLVHSWLPSSVVMNPDNANTPAFPAANTTFIHVVTDTLTGCQLQDSVSVIVSNTYHATATNDTAVCMGTGLPLQVVHNVPAPANITWSPAAHLTGANSANPVVLLDSTMAYVVQVSDAAGCVARDTVLVNVAFSGIQIMADTAFCQGGSFLLDAGFPLADHAWSTGENTQSIIVENPGDYTVTMTDSLGCQRIHTTQVTVHPLPAVDLGVDPGLCEGESLTLFAGNGGTPLWNTGAQTASITVSTNGTYGVQVTDNFGCINSDSVALTFHPMPIVYLADTIACTSALIDYDAGNPGSSYLWSTGETTATVTVTGNSLALAVVVTTANNCVDSAQAMVTFIPYPEVDLGPDTALCDEQQITLDAGNPGASYFWSTGSTEGAETFTHNALAWVAVHNGYCTTFDTVNVVFNPLPLRDLEPFTVACLEEPPHYTVLDANNPDCSFLWNTGETTQTILGTAYQTYSVIVTTPLDCSVEETIDLLEYCPSTIFIPNSFTPNGDGVNDLFFPVGNNIASVRLTVFDRWGARIFDGKDGNAAWDGTMNGQVVQNGVYVWKLNYRYFEDVQQSIIGPAMERMGHVTVVH